MSAQSLMEKRPLLGCAALVQNDDVRLDLFLQEAQNAIQGLTSAVVEKNADIEIRPRGWLDLSCHRETDIHVRVKDGLRRAWGRWFAQWRSIA